MTPGFLVVFLLGFGFTFWRDRKDLRQAKTSEKAIYWSLAVLTFAGFFCSYTNMHVPMPTEIIVYKFAPWFHPFTKV